MAEYPELLFFDTFSHGNAQELNLDLVQFTNPVYVTEIRVIPLGARVHADFPGGVRLGATNPSEFSVEFFVNDLSLPGATTFQNLGVLEYNQNGPIQYKCDNKQIPTDGLILRGWYTTVTLAVYGFITKTRPPPSNLVSQPNIPPTAETPPLRVISEHKTAQWVQQHAQVYHKESDAYDVKELSYEEETPEWSQENKTEENKTQWEKDESAKKSPTQDERKSSRKRNTDSLTVKTNHRRSPPEKKLADREVESNEHKKSEDKKSRVEKPYRSPPSRLPQLHGESKNKLDNSLQDDEKSPVEVSEPPIELVEQIKEESLEKVDSPEVVKNEPEPEPEPEPRPVDPVVPAPVVSVPLASEDVEMISDEEISEEEVDSPSMSGMQVMDEVNEVPAETLVLSAQEDSLDMDQFEPILSGSSDIESEDDLDVQDLVLDPNDLADEPSKIFDPFLFEVQPLMSMKPLQVTNYEWKLLQPKVLESVSASSEKVDKFKTLLANIEQKSFEEGMDDWVTTIESLIPVLEVGLIDCQSRAETFDQFIKLVDVGLNFEKAYNQPKPVFKVRHLKAGICLAETLCRCNEEMTVELIKSVDLQHRLWDIYEKEHLALSVKLAILKALDVTLDYGNGVKYFVTVRNDSSGYRRLLRVLSKTPTIRVRYSLTNLLRKVHLYEILEDVSAMSESANGDNEVVETLSMGLEGVIKYLHEAPTLISQPTRFLPICSRFEFPITDTSSYFAVYSYFVHFNFLELLANVITVPQFVTDSHIVASVLEILAEFLDTEHGLIYLASQWTATNRLLKILSNMDDQYLISPQLGLHLAHRLYVLTLIDNFNYKWQVEQVADIDNSQLLDILSSLYYLTFTALGRHSIIHVLSRGDIIKPLLRALQYSHNAGRERRKSPGKAYIVDLVWLVVKGSDYVPFLKRHYRDLIEITSWQSDLNNSAWLNPVRNGDQSFSFDDVTELCDYLKKHTDKVTTFPGELITALRILRYLSAQPAKRKCEDLEEVSELKYKYVLIQVFAQEGLTFMISMLHKICNHYERPHLHAYTLAGKEGTSMIAVLMPILQIMHALLEYVIRCRDIEFKDLTAVLPLIKTFCLLHSISPTSPIHAESVEGSKEIVETLLVYTQTVAIEPTCDTRSLNKSLWTSMISEILKYSVSVPEMFVPCLTLLSELLPLPFPIQTRVALSEAEVSQMTISRKLWSAHLLPLDSALLEMISTFCCSSYQPLLQLMKRVCVQLADLGPPTALVVARSILNSVWSELSTCERHLTSNCVRLLGVLACLLTHPPLKMTVIQVTTGSSKTDETFSEFWPTLLKFISQPAEGNVYHVQAQEFIISSIQSLCDIEISLHPPPSQSVSLETYLSNSLPPKNLFRSACESLVTQIQNAENTFSTLSATLRACTTLLEYNYGVYRLKTCLSEHSGVLWNVVRKLAAEWNKENPDCISCLTNLLEFFKSCISSSGTPEVNANLRTLLISAFELVEYLRWNAENTNTEAEKHPLLVISALLLECEPEEELFQTLRSDVNAFIETLNAAQDKYDAGDSVIETILDPPESLLAQFQARLVYVVGDVDDERLSVAYWLSMTPLDELEQETEQVTCNLEEVASSCFPNLKLDVELGRLGHRETIHAEQNAKKLDTVEQIETFESKPTQTVLVKPAKPRSYIRPIIGPHRNDAFRSRIPNSSRAPSLHVDDFIALEKHNQQQAAAGYNRLTVKHQGPDILSAARNRSLSFLQDRTSHFHSPFRPNRGILNSWHPLLAAEQATRTVVKTQPPSVIRHPASATPLMIRGADLMRFSLSLSRWPSPPLRPPPVPQMRHLPPPHSSLHRHLRPPPPSF